MGMVSYYLFWFMTRKIHAAAFMASVCIFSFYTYGFAWGYWYQLTINRQPISFALIWFVLTTALITWLGRKTPQSPSPDIVSSVNLMTIILLLFPIIQTFRYISTLQTPFPSKTNYTLRESSSQSRPDIYYIILDSYARADVLAELYDYDNSPFLQSLEEMGFYVASCSQSNYASTSLSLTSTLNLDYLQNMNDTFTPDQTELMGVFKLLQDNNVKATVTNLGYTTAAFSSGFIWAEWQNADIFLSPPHGPVTEFETVILFSTYLRILDDMGIVNIDDLNADRFRTRTNFALNSFDDLLDIKGPKFVFIHLIVPHPPFALDENGNPTAPDQMEAGQGYMNQVKFINNFITPKLKQLIEESPSKPIIILQGDHGRFQPNNPPLQMKILNAYYLPQGSQTLYPSISPVNTFRVIFNEYFGTKLPLLDDVSYYSGLSRDFDFTIVPNTCP